MNKQIDMKFWTITGLIALSIIIRLLHIIPNFSPVMSLALFGGAYYTNKKIAFIIPFSVMIISDIFLGFHSTMWAVYLSFGLAVLLGFNLRQNNNFSRILLNSLLGSIIFFVLTNFAYWITYLPINTSGFVKCYVDAIPFYRNTLAGDLIYTFVLFGGYKLAEKYIPALIKS